MELPLESLSSFRPRTATMDAWNAAYVRAEDYLRAHRIHNRLHEQMVAAEHLDRRMFNLGMYTATSDYHQTHDQK